ncbi:dentin sialophosphoprotein-like [Mesocricetus auratus]|uniref:Dentin sialophosphoprotein-like n=1 Tax=Mesocricetus auratus TaxID=10036 RepID=A0ABM2W5N5_MESAU|nr:dentin sialophosphoprotein-like [Mesocricetus auratus]
MVELLCVKIHFSGYQSSTDYSESPEEDSQESARSLKVVSRKELFRKTKSNLKRGHPSHDRERSRPDPHVNPRSISTVIEESQETDIRESARSPKVVSRKELFQKIKANLKRGHPSHDNERSRPGPHVNPRSISTIIEDDSDSYEEHDENGISKENSFKSDDLVSGSNGVPGHIQFSTGFVPDANVTVYDTNKDQYDTYDLDDTTTYDGSNANYGDDATIKDDYDTYDTIDDTSKDDYDTNYVNDNTEEELDTYNLGDIATYDDSNTNYVNDNTEEELDTYNLGDIATYDDSSKENSLQSDDLGGDTNYVNDNTEEELDTYNLGDIATYDDSNTNYVNDNTEEELDTYDMIDDTSKDDYDTYDQGDTATNDDSNTNYVNGNTEEELDTYNLGDITTYDDSNTNDVDNATTKEDLDTNDIVENTEDDSDTYDTTDDTSENEYDTYDATDDTSEDASDTSDIDADPIKEESDTNNTENSNSMTDKSSDNLETEQNICVLSDKDQRKTIPKEKINPPPIKVQSKKNRCFHALMRRLGLKHPKSSRVGPEIKTADQTENACGISKGLPKEDQGTSLEERAKPSPVVVQSRKRRFLTATLRKLGLRCYISPCTRPEPSMVKMTDKACDTNDDYGNNYSDSKDNVAIASTSNLACPSDPVEPAEAPCPAWEHKK